MPDVSKVETGILITAGIIVLVLNVIFFGGFKGIFAGPDVSEIAQSVQNIQNAIKKNTNASTNIQETQSNTNTPFNTVPTDIKTNPGSSLWVDNVFSPTATAILTVILMIVLFISIFMGSSLGLSIQNVSKNWEQYRCSPMIMPLAGLFGHNTYENFEYCMGSIFEQHAAGTTSGFSGVLGVFVTVLSTIMETINGVILSVASLGGGINVVMQDFVTRISQFFASLRMNFMYMKNLFTRLYSIFMSMLFMGQSTIIGGVSFANTSLFGFLDTFCFPENTLILTKEHGEIPISKIKIGDTLLPTNSKVTSTMKFYAKGQPMVAFYRRGFTQKPIYVSTNHFIKYNDKWIKAREHPDAIRCLEWTGDIDKPLICLNTDTHEIPIQDLIFSDYDEIDSANNAAMKELEQQINSEKNTFDTKYPFTEASPSISANTLIRVKRNNKYEYAHAKDIKIGDILTTGSLISGIIKKEITEYTNISDDMTLAAATLLWIPADNKWKRAGTLYPIKKSDTPQVFYAFIAAGNSIIELDNNIYIRDYMEVCSPDSENQYETAMKAKI
jgi:hypothetical protein